MRILALDTTTHSESVVLFEGPKLIAEINTEVTTTHSSRLLRAIDELLKLARIDIQAVEGYAVAAGPGSFTGIRIGLSTVKALAFASGKRIAPVSSLRALALKIAEVQTRLLCPLLDAKKGEIFAALFEGKRHQLVEVISQGAYAPDSFFSLLPAHRVVHFIGNGVPVFREKILAYLRDKARFSDRSLFIGREVGILGQEMLKNGRGVTAEELAPLYFRKSQAEEKK